MRDERKAKEALFKRHPELHENGPKDRQQRMVVTEGAWLRGLHILFGGRLEAQSLVRDNVFDDLEDLPYNKVFVTFPKDKSQYVTEIPGEGTWVFIREKPKG